MSALVVGLIVAGALVWWALAAVLIANATEEDDEQ